ncbi:hypothetical protein E2L06_17935 [Haloterrigena sp. H1]|uniref:PQQ-binding-like beta-propeller repeat protein n=1 Tax=Haloterrigena sp. H1 TaxID=2552943 RepID=UPI00110DCEF8|nr:PQQ-binding-like beta-propeller repeat protein [Haloterrigena sp. H1]TMT77890.1 hypothetical protein E2L06_21105 [Haloterrigena sp. H1]TMT81783.1 hypothetical protein E2L06_17935 [Haloterrigena sp. H1]
MPSTRRLFLATVGTATLSGCARLDLSKSDKQRLAPKPFLTEAGDWEHPNYDAANTNATLEYAAPDTLSESTNWVATYTARTIDNVAGPIVADGIAYLVYAGVDRGEEFERLIAVDARTGEERWQVEIRGSAFAYPPTVAGETVFWLTSVDKLYALNTADGTIQWTHDSRNYRRPIVTHGLVVTVGGTLSEPVLEALDPYTGTPYWTRSEDNRDWHLVAANNEAIYVTLSAAHDGESSELHALEPHTGETRWRNSTVAPRNAAVRSSYLLASIGRPDAQKLFALNLTTQDLKWSETADLQYEMGRQTINGEQSVAAVAENRSLVHHGFHDYTHDRVECRDLNSGNVLWTVVGEGDGTVSFSLPVIAGGSMYLTEHHERSEETSSSRLRVFDLQDGTEQTQVMISEQSVGSPVIADEQVFLSTWLPRNRVSLSAR